MASSLDIASFQTFSSNNVNVPKGGVGGNSASTAAQMQQEMNKFQSLIDGIQAGMSNSEKKSTLSSSQIAEDGRINGDYTSSLADAFNTPADKASRPVGAAANAVGAHGFSSNEMIDRTSRLYKQSLELESYFVKILLSSMRNTITKTNLGGSQNEYAQNLYEDMLYDELATSVTKSAGFGLADQIYLQLS